MNKKLAILFSGGKDSCLALHKVLKKGGDVRYLLSVIPENKDSFMFHKPDLNLLKKQAEMLRIELIVGKSKGEKEKELRDLENLIKGVRKEIGGVVVGGIASSYQGKRIKKICDKFGLEFIAPLWNYGSEQIWKELLKEKFEVVITKVSCEGLDGKWVGRKIGKEEFEELKRLSEKFKFRMDFEGGEAETCVLWMPGFKKKIKIKFDVAGDGKFRWFMRKVRIL